MKVKNVSCILKFGKILHNSIVIKEIVFFFPHFNTHLSEIGIGEGVEKNLTTCRQGGRRGKKSSKIPHVINGRPLKHWRSFAYKLTYANVLPSLVDITLDIALDKFVKKPRCAYADKHSFLTRYRLH